jgi:hypothetical protein
MTRHLRELLDGPQCPWVIANIDHAPVQIARRFETPAGDDCRLEVCCPLKAIHRLEEQRVCV